MPSYWMSSVKMTFVAETDTAGRVIATAPIAQKFVGQSLAALRSWMQRQGGYREVELETNATS